MFTQSPKSLFLTVSRRGQVMASTMAFSLEHACELLPLRRSSDCVWPASEYFGKLNSELRQSLDNTRKALVQLASVIEPSEFLD